MRKKIIFRCGTAASETGEYENCVGMLDHNFQKCNTIFGFEMCRGKSLPAQWRLLGPLTGDADINFHRHFFDVLHTSRAHRDFQYSASFFGFSGITFDDDLVVDDVYQFGRGSLDLVVKKAKGTF